ncbi:MAG: DUF4351 domain-containing protein [Candidatus Accumulibacter sp.]|nr:DUF4351 domain-containing protein [Accumulibacter sp.]
MLDWKMWLQDRLAQMLRQDNAVIEGESKMRYVTSVERLAFQRGIELGIQQGEQIREQRGAQKGAARIIQRQLTKRFGPLDAETLTRLQTSPCEQLESWAENLLDAATLDEVFKDN